jgi:hypothetical protein
MRTLSGVSSRFARLCLSSELLPWSRARSQPLPRERMHRSGPGMWGVQAAPSSGDDSFFYYVSVADNAYDLNPAPRTRRVDLACDAGADFVQPHGRFRHGAGFPHQPPRVAVRPPLVRGSCGEFDCRWRRGQRLVVTIRNRSRSVVRLRSARVEIQHWNSDPAPYERFVTLASRPRLRLPARGSVALVLKLRGRRACRGRKFGFARAPARAPAPVVSQPFGFGSDASASAVMRKR